MAARYDHLDVQIALCTNGEWEASLFDQDGDAVTTVFAVGPVEALEAVTRSPHVPWADLMQTAADRLGDERSE